MCEVWINVGVVDATSQCGFRQSRHQEKWNVLVYFKTEHFSIPQRCRDFILLLLLGFKVYTVLVIVPVVISNGLRAGASREAISLKYLRHTCRRSVLHAWVQSPIHPHNHHQLHQPAACSLQGLVTYSTKWP